MNPIKFKYKITFIVDILNLLWIQVPKLLNNALERFAANPIRAIYFELKSNSLNITPNRDPYVQFMPTIDPQHITMVTVNL